MLVEAHRYSTPRYGLERWLGSPWLFQQPVFLRCKKCWTLTDEIRYVLNLQSMHRSSSIYIYMYIYIHIYVHAWHRGWLSAISGEHCSVQRPMVYDSLVISRCDVTTHHTHPSSELPLLQHLITRRKARTSSWTVSFGCLSQMTTDFR
jgi:hypothetical protein